MVLIAVEGCCHGELDTIYRSIAEAVRRGTPQPDLLICCGDFQSLRSPADFAGYAAPPKYHNLRTFHRYYSGAALAPVLTVFIGGNHEASMFLQELPYGGWVAPNIYYLGAAGAVRFRGLRIAGVSGIYEARHFHQGHYERPPYNPNTLRSVYHTRSLDAFRLGLLRRPVDVFLSHDWPAGIAMFGDHEDLLRRKGFLRREVYDGSLGSPPNRHLLQSLRPRYWFAAHLHCKFAALVPHGPPPPSEAEPVDEAEIDLSDVGDPSAMQAAAKEKSAEVPDGPYAVAATTAESGGSEAQFTRFLALDKCLSRRDFLQIVTLPDRDIEGATASSGLCYDAEWCAILRKTWTMETGSSAKVRLPEAGAAEVSQAEVEEAHGAVAGALGHDPAVRNLPIPQNFQRTGPTEEDFRQMAATRNFPKPTLLPNPQTDAFLAALQLPHLVTVPTSSQ